MVHERFLMNIQKMREIAIKPANHVGILRMHHEHVDNVTTHIFRHTQGSCTANSLLLLYSGLAQNDFKRNTILACEGG